MYNMYILYIFSDMQCNEFVVQEIVLRMESTAVQYRVVYIFNAMKLGVQQQIESIAN